MPFLWKCYIWVVVGVVGYIVGAARWALDENRDKPLGLVNCSHYQENRYGDEQNKKRRGLRNCAVTRKT